MPIKREDDFLRWSDAPSGPGLGIESDRLPACIAQIKENGIKGAFGSPSFGFTGQDLDFMKDIPCLERVWFWDVELKNINGLYALANLRHFGVHPKRPPIQFDRFPHLETAVVEPQARDSGLDRLQNLHELHLWRAKDTRLASLELPDSLVALQLNWTSMRNLNHLPALPKLRRLELHRCRNLEELGVLCEKYPNLEHLVVDACGGMTAEAGARSIEGLTKLKHAFVQTAALVPPSLRA